jgi:catechol 2,3-dioxygenase-like lactoylglutathione lyase family enzyme
MVNHIGLQYSDKAEAEIFFSKVLGFSKVREFTVPEELAEAIFGIRKSVEVVDYGDDRIKFEIFFTDQPLSYVYEHIGLNVPNKTEFIERCKNNGIEPIIAKKGEKDLLFIKDFAGHLYEIKEG